MPAARQVLDLEPVRAEGKSAAAHGRTDRRSGWRRCPEERPTRSFGCGCTTFPRHVARELEPCRHPGATRPTALHFHLDLRRPEIQRTVGVGAPGRRQTLARAGAPLTSSGRPLPAELDREAFVRLGQELMDTVERDLAGGLMQINRLRLLNFRQHENTEIELGAGLTGIIGPNGAGKTTILEAIAWAMYGMPAARGNRETLRRRGAPPRARVEVEVEFTLGPHQYRIVRSLNSAELYQDGDPLTDRQQPSAP